MSKRSIFHFDWYLWGVYLWASKNHRLNEFVRAQLRHAYTPECADKKRNNLQHEPSSSCGIPFERKRKLKRILNVCLVDTHTIYCDDGFWRFFRAQTRAIKCATDRQFLFTAAAWTRKKSPLMAKRLYAAIGARAHVQSCSKWFAWIS